MKSFLCWRTLLVLPVVAALWAFMPNPASADTLWNLTTFNTTNATVSSPYATVEVNGNTATGTVAFTVTLTAANQSVATLGEFGFNVSSAVAAAVGGHTLTFNSGSSVVLGTGNTSAWTTTGTVPGPAVLSTGTSMDGYGKFDYVVGPANTANANRMTTYMFTWQFDNAADFGLATDANFEQLTGPPNAGHMFASHLFPLNGNTGFIDGAETPSPVPEPSSIILGLCGLVGLGLTQIRRLVRRNPLALA